MDREKIITEYLYRVNAPVLEHSELTEIQNGTPVAHAEWVALDDVGRCATVGYPLRFDQKEKKVLLTHGLCHSFIVSSTGKGKTTVLLENTVDILSRFSDDKRPNLFLTDPKGELAPILIPQLRDKYEIYIMNLKDPAAGNVRINPLSDAYKSHHKQLELLRKRETINYLKDEQAYMDICDEIENQQRIRERSLMNFAYSCNPYESTAKEQCWSQGGRVMHFAAGKVCLYESEDPRNEIEEEDFNPALLADIEASTQDDCEDLIEYFKRHKDDPDVKKAIASPLSISAKQTRDSYLSTANTGISKWSSFSLRRLTSRSTLDFDELARGEKPFVLFIIADDTEREKDELAKFSIERFLRALQDEADKQPDGRLKRETVFLLDEFCNFPSMNTVTQNVTISRSRGIYFTFVIQNFEQMVDRYAENVTNAVFDNCDIQICLGSNSYSSKKRFADEFGKQAHNVQSVNISADGSYSRNITTTEIPVLKVSDIEKLTLGQFYLRFKGQGYLSFITPYFERDDVNHVREALPRLNRCFDDYVPRSAYDIRRVLDRDRPKRPYGRSRFGSIFDNDSSIGYGSSSIFDDDLFPKDEPSVDDDHDDVPDGGDPKEAPSESTSFEEIFERIIKKKK